MRRATASSASRDTRRGPWKADTTMKKHVVCECPRSERKWDPPVSDTLARVIGIPTRVNVIRRFDCCANPLSSVSSLMVFAFVVLRFRPGYTIVIGWLVSTTLKYTVHTALKFLLRRIFLNQAVNQAGKRTAALAPRCAAPGSCNCLSPAFLVPNH